MSLASENDSIAFMDEAARKPDRFLLHACCGPCSMEPVRLLRERGIEPLIYYANSNIAPQGEYEHRLQTIRKWAASENLDIVEGEYTPDDWEARAGCIGAAEDPANAQASERRAARCRACYRMRFEESARYAAENGFDTLGTTLSVSPYQYTQVIREELERACSMFGLYPFFEDYRPYYDEATRRSRDAGMYRQNYCGCRFSEEEAQAEREARRAQRAAERESKAAATAEKRAAEAEAAAARKAERAAYDEKRARQRAILKQMREQRSNESKR